MENIATAIKGSKNEAGVFWMSDVLKSLDFCSLVPCFLDVVSCTAEGGYTAVPKKHEIGDKKECSNGFGTECVRVSSSLGGHTSYAKYAKEDMDFVKWEYLDLMKYIKDKDLAKHCNYDIRHNEDLLPANLFKFRSHI